MSPTLRLLVGRVNYKYNTSNLSKVCQTQLRLSKAINYDTYKSIHSSIKIAYLVIFMHLEASHNQSYSKVYLKQCLNV